MVLDKVCGHVPKNESMRSNLENELWREIGNVFRGQNRALSLFLIPNAIHCGQSSLPFRLGVLES